MKYINWIMSCVMLALVGASGFMLLLNTPQPAREPFMSVEMNLQEVSPLGAAGGFAVPASGASVPGNVGHTCSPDNRSVTIDWTPSSDLQGHSHEIRYHFRLDKMNPLVSWNAECHGVSGWWPGTGGDPLPGDVCINGLTETKWTGSIEPDTQYRWWVHAVQREGGFWSDAAEGAVTVFTCASAPSGNPRVTLQVRNNSAGTGWQNGPITIDAGDDLDLLWQGADVSECTGSNFETGASKPTSGTQPAVTTPPAGSIQAYTVDCFGEFGPAHDTVLVSVRTPADEPDTPNDPETPDTPEDPDTPDDPDSPVVNTIDITAIPAIVRVGEESVVTWRLNGAIGCRVTGPGLSQSVDADGSEKVTILAQSTYVLTCGALTDSATVRVLPTYGET